MNLLDYIILLILLLSALSGFKKGLISTIITFAGTIIVIILAYFLKNPISVLLYSKLPFFTFPGKYSGMSIVNILVFEAISFIITLFILSIIMGIIIKVSKAFSKALDSEVSLPSKIFGGIFGLVEGIFISFIIVFLLGLISPFSSLYGNSKYANTILEKTPIISSIASNSYKSMSEIYDVALSNDAKNDKTLANTMGLKILLKYEIITPDTAYELVNQGKINIENADDIIEEYKKGNKE